MRATALTPLTAFRSRPAEPGSAEGSRRCGPAPFRARAEHCALRDRTRSGASGTCGSHSSLRRHLALDPAGVLLVLERVEVELDDPFLPVEGVPPPDGDVRAGDLDDVVTGPRVAAQAQRRDGAGVDHEQVLELPRVRNVLVARQHEVHARTLKALDCVSCVVDDVPLAPGAR